MSKAQSYFRTHVEQLAHVRVAVWYVGIKSNNSIRGEMYTAEVMGRSVEGGNVGCEEMRCYIQLAYGHQKKATFCRPGGAFSGIFLMSPLWNVCVEAIMTVAC